MTTNWNPNEITIEQYAQAIIREIKVDSANDPDFARCRSWEDLHDICDANDYYQDTDMALGLTMPSSDESEDDFEAYMTYLSKASDIVEEWLSKRASA